jgi:hypothetical protein
VEELIAIGQFARVARHVAPELDAKASCAIDASFCRPLRALSAKATFASYALLLARVALAPSVNKRFAGTAKHRCGGIGFQPQS